MVFISNSDSNICKVIPHNALSEMEVTTCYLEAKSKVFISYHFKELPRMSKYLSSAVNYLFELA